MVFTKGRARQVFIFCCFALGLVISVYVAATSIPHMPLLGIATAVLMVAEALCILFYGLAFRPARWRWVARMVPLLFVLPYAGDWLYAGGLPNEEPFAWAVFWGSVLPCATNWVLLYFLFRYGYSSKLPPAAFSIRTISVALLAAGFIAFIQHVPVFTPRVRVAHNYVAEYNALARPVLYDVDENAAFDYLRLGRRISPMPEDVNRVRDFWPGDMNDGERGAVRAWTMAEPNVTPALLVAGGKAHYWVERRAPNGYLMEADISELRDVRELAYCLLLHARLEACERNVEGALEEILTGYAMGTQLVGPRSGIEQVVGMALCNLSLKSAFQVLSQIHVESTLLQSFQDRLRRLSTRWDHGFDCAADRLMILDWIQRSFSDDGNGGGCISRRRSLRLGWGWVRIDRAETIRLLDDVIASLAVETQMTPWQCHTQGHSTLDFWERQNNPALREDVSGWSVSVSLWWRLRTHTTALLTTLALLRYRADTARLPAALDELVSAGYLAALPMDPFGDGPLVYRRQGGDFVLYSRAVDLDDDGGVPSDWGKDEAGGDKVFWPVAPAGDKIQGPMDEPSSGSTH
jgi:hypothetical protein